MATLTTSQKAPLIVTTEAGTPLQPDQQTVELGDDTCVHLANVGGGQGVNYIVADAAGSATVTVTSAGQIGTLDVTVTPAPLTVGLGSPEPK